MSEVLLGEGTAAMRYPLLAIAVIAEAEPLPPVDMLLHQVLTLAAKEGEQADPGAVAMAIHVLIANGGNSALRALEREMRAQPSESALARIIEQVLDEFPVHPRWGRELSHGDSF